MTQQGANRRVIIFALAVVLFVRQLAALPQVAEQALAQGGTIPTPTRPNGKPPQPTSEETAPPPRATELPETTVSPAPTATSSAAVIITAPPQSSSLPTLSASTGTATAAAPTGSPELPAQTASAVVPSVTVERSATAVPQGEAPQTQGTAPIELDGASTAGPGDLSPQALPTWTTAVRLAPIVPAQAGSSAICCLLGVVSAVLIGVGVVVLTRRRRGI